ncbi:MAG: hypothetical protein JWM28_1735, partial [Chitinophagaceae bacterium]|nr:hypothetical protein [Chitinophagaceae bacterium]
ALAFLSGHAEKYHYKSNEFVLIGASAGAHLAMLYAYGYDSAKQIKAVVDFFGPTDLSDRITRTRNKLFDSRAANWSGTDDPQSQLSLDASPYYRLTKETGVPTILFHGGEDSIIHFSQSEKIYKKLLALNIATQYEFYPQEGHGFSTKAGREALIQTLAWLEKYYPAQ